VAIAEKQNPAANPVFAPDIQDETPTLLRKMATPIVEMSMQTNERIIICAIPFFAFGSLAFTPVYFIQGLANKIFEYHIAPSIK
jgi:hypothetical protein